MKKNLLILVAMIATVTANAQIWIGGSLKFQKNDDADFGEIETLYGISPEIGYNLSEDWAVALSLEYSHTEAEDFLDMHSFSVAPYARYNFVQAGNLRLFLDGGFEIISFGSEEREYSVWNVGIKPGISYSLTEKFSLVAHMGFFGYQKVDDDLLGVETLVYKNGFGFDFTNHLSFGVYYAF